MTAEEVVGMTEGDMVEIVIGDTVVVVVTMMIGDLMIEMVAIVKETTEAMVLGADEMTAVVADMTAGVTAGAIADLLTAVK
jgi:ABC-type amino acid transport system permease subunit